ncbi:hypothetical protein [Chryseobacterium nematophagum]|uniref:hypothetical protein n=1 Tax=Chryseobacterium nematophagum TaxID=2305228 RepID=UPI001604D606|nr:hypothetical protein [Chryseobacterium nematophagum]
MKLANLNTVKPLDLKTIKVVSGGYKQSSLEEAEGSKRRDVESTSNDSLKHD